MSATANHKATRYIVISPVRDEAEYLDETIRSMVAQTVRPMQWIIVNDGSTDGTAEIIDRWAAEQPWIRAVHRENRGRREPGSGVIEAFYEGYETVSDPDWEYVVKLDGDLSFEPKYFEECFEEFDSDPALGIGGGVICHMFNGQLQVEPNPTFHVRGATKIYKRACWEQIVSLIRAPGWDTIDEVKANMLGWRTRSFENLKLVHYRFTGAATGAWRNSIKNGVGSYISGYHPLFMFFKSIKRLVEKPYLVVSAGLLYGFVLGYMRRIPQIEDRGLILYLRQQQIRRLRLSASIWK
jgi:biofilm PGA synthesis N-glycosyltransferase PgaC